jgi:hypothetical protein
LSRRRRAPRPPECWPQRQIGHAPNGRAFFARADIGGTDILIEVETCQPLDLIDRRQKVLYLAKFVDVTKGFGLAMISAVPSPSGQTSITWLWSASNAIERSSPPSFQTVTLKKPGRDLEPAE